MRRTAIVLLVLAAGAGILYSQARSGAISPWTLTLSREYTLPLLMGDLSVSWSTVTGATLDAMKEAELPSACRACGACAKRCPQGIDIPGIMKKFAGTIADMSR
jgi:ferredoxin